MTAHELHELIRALPIGALPPDVTFDRGKWWFPDHVAPVELVILCFEASVARWLSIHLPDWAVVNRNNVVAIHVVCRHALAFTAEPLAAGPTYLHALVTACVTHRRRSAV